MAMTPVTRVVVTSRVALNQGSSNFDCNQLAFINIQRFCHCSTLYVARPTQRALTLAPAGAPKGRGQTSLASTWHYPKTAVLPI